MLMMALFVIAGAAFYFMTADERMRVLRRTAAGAATLYEAAEGGPPDSSFRATLRERTPRAVVTPLLIAANLVMFVMVLFSAGTMSQAAVEWGANLGPRTTNGEWNRLVISMFVHSGFIQLVVNLAGLMALGFITERLVGSLTFATVYLTSGVLAGIVSLWTDQLTPTFGPSAAILGIYGLLAACVIRLFLARSGGLIPWKELRNLGVTAGVFALITVLGGNVSMASDISGFVVGLASGLALTHGIGDQKPNVRRVGSAFAVATAVAFLAALPLAGIDDVRTELANVAAIEGKTAGAYEAEIDRLRKGRTTTEALAHLIDRTILPELHAAEARMKTFDKVVPEQRPLVDRAGTYLRLREESWQLRAEGLRTMWKLQRAGHAPQQPGAPRLRAEDLRKSSALALTNAETRERASLAALSEMVTLLGTL